MEDGGAAGGNWDGLPPEILDMIFKHLSVSDLLSCSIVSKNWKTAARDVLKRNRECYAHIKYFDEDIQDLNEMIASTDIMQMINGLHIRNEVRPKEELGRDSPLWHNSRKCSDVARILQLEGAEVKLDETKQKILGVLSEQWRYLDLDMGEEWKHVVSLDTGLLLREVILATSDSLQKLVIGQDRDWKFIPCCAKPFLKLTVIQAQKEQHLDCCRKSSLSKFAPNLQEITGVMIDLPVPFQGKVFRIERMKNIRALPQCAMCRNRSHDAQCWMPHWVIPHGKAKEVFHAVSGLHRLDLQSYRRHPFDSHEEQNLVEFTACVFPFLLRSLNTLKELRMYTLDLYNLSMASDELKFPNLRRLSLAAHRNVSRANEIWALKNLNLPKLCPNLDGFEILGAGLLTNDHDVEDDVVPVPGGEPDGLYQINMLMAVDLNCRRGLHDHDDGVYNHGHLEFLLTIYPKLTKVRILKMRNVADYDMSKIFWEVQSLEYLEIQVLRPPYEIEFGLEALLCGINIEEAKLPFLKYQKKEDKLNSCIVPIRPSLLNAKNLKELKITEDPQTVQRVPMVRRSWVTQVTENLPEHHVRSLTVSFDGSKDLYSRLNRMRAFTWLRAHKKRGKLLESSQYWWDFIRRSS